MYISSYSLFPDWGWEGVTNSTVQRDNATPIITGFVYRDMATEKKMVQGNEHTVIAPSVLTVRMIMQGKVRKVAVSKPLSN